MMLCLLPSDCPVLYHPLCLLLFLYSLPNPLMFSVHLISESYQGSFEMVFPVGCIELRKLGRDKTFDSFGLI